MSSSDDDEWEREQMLRGCQSRQKYSKQGITQANVASATTASTKKKTQSSGPQVIDVTLAKEHLAKENERLTEKLEDMKRTIGGLKRDLAERENRKNSLKKLIAQLEADRAADVSVSVGAGGDISADG